MMDMELIESVRALMRLGRSNNEIALFLGKPRSTIREYRNHILGRTGPPLSSKWWSREQDETLINLWALGLSASQVGSELNKTRCAVLGRLHRLHVPPRPRERSVSVKSNHKGRQPRLVARLSALIPEPVAPPPENAVTLLDLEERHCRYPVSQGLYCGATKRQVLVDGQAIYDSSYCPYHANLCTTTRDPYAQPTRHRFTLSSQR